MEYQYPTMAATADPGLKPLVQFAVSLTANFALKISAQPEDQLKGPVSNLVKSVGDVIAKQVETRTEAKADDVAGRPDMAVAVGKLLTGYIELKAPGKGASPNLFTLRQDRDQWRRFKQIPNLVYTDGSQWALYRSGERIGNLVSLTGDVTRDGAKAISPLDVVNLNAMLADFLLWKPIVPTSPSVLAEVLAPLCHMLREDVFTAVIKPASNLHQLANEWRTALFPNADDAQFADAYAQTGPMPCF